MAPLVTILDDYQGTAMDSADWTAVRRLFDVEAISEHIGDVEALVDRLSESQVVVAMRERTPFPASTLARLPALRLLVTTGIANAAIDVEAANALGITVCGTGRGNNVMPEFTWGMIIALVRNFAPEDAGMRRGAWQHTLGTGLADRTLGVLGLGRIGAPVARLGLAFGMRVIAWTPSLTPDRAAEHGVEAVSKQQLFAESDVLTIHVPLSDRSRGLVGSTELALMKPTAFLINTSRGAVVDEDALIEALKQHRIAGAGLDVYATEPLPVDHPLRTLRNTLLLPHIGYVTREVYSVFYSDAVADILAWADGAPIRVLQLLASGRIAVQ